MSQSTKAITLTNRAPLEDYIETARDRIAFRNTTKTFRGGSVTPMETLRAARTPWNTPDVSFAIVMDEPDYIIWSNDRPIAWHSTTRGIGSKALPPNPERWEWVVYPNAEKEFNNSHHRVANHIVTTLNGELDNA